MSTNTGPRSAARYRNQFSHIWLSSSVDKGLTVDLKDPDSIPSQGDFFSFKFLSKRKWTKWWTRITRTTTTQVIPWSLANGGRQKKPRFKPGLLRQNTVALPLAPPSLPMYLSVWGPFVSFSIFLFKFLETGWSIVPSYSLRISLKHRQSCRSVKSFLPLQLSLEVEWAWALARRPSLNFRLAVNKP